MTITRRQRINEESRLTRLNNKKIKSANLKTRLTVLGTGLFIGGAVAESSNALIPTVHAQSTNYGTDTASADTSDTQTTPIITPRGVGDQDFINYIGNSARKLAQNNDIYASVMIAQAMIESGWGTSGLSTAPNYNLFGIKGSYNGSSVNMGTQEDDGTGSLYSINSDFKKYPSYKESLEDYVSLIRGGVTGDPEIYSGAWKSNTSSYKDATAYLTGRYATDTTYADKLNSVIEKYNLTQFDDPATGDTTNQDQTYVVSQGDTMQSIAQKFNLGVDSLMDLNNLKSSSYLYPGKSLTVLKVIGNESQSDPNAVNVTNQIDDKTKDVYGTDQAPVIVQDDTDGVKKHDTSNDSSNSTNSTVNVTNDLNSDTNSSNQQVTVQSGDTIESIAAQANTSADQIRQNNNLNSDLLVVGQKLLV